MVYLQLCFVAIDAFANCEAISSSKVRRFVYLNFKTYYTVCLTFTVNLLPTLQIWHRAYRDFKTGINLSAYQRQPFACWGKRPYDLMTLEKNIYRFSTIIHRDDKYLIGIQLKLLKIIRSY